MTKQFEEGGAGDFELQHIFATLHKRRIVFTFQCLLKQAIEPLAHLFKVVRLQHVALRFREAMFHHPVHHASEGAGFHGGLKLGGFSHPIEVAVGEVARTLEKGVDGAGGHAFRGPLAQTTTHPFTDFELGNVRPRIRQGQLVHHVVHLEVRRAVRLVKRPFELHEVAGRFAAVFFVRGSSVQKVNLLGTVHQPVNQVRVARFPFPWARHVQGMAQVQGEEAVRHGRLGNDAFVHVEHEHPVKIQGTGFGQAHDLQPLVGFSQQVDAFLTKEPSCHDANLSGVGHRGVGVLEPLQHRQHRPEASPPRGDPRNFSVGVGRVVLRLVAFQIQRWRQGLHPLLQRQGPMAQGMEKSRRVVGFQSVQLGEVLRPSLGIVSKKVAGLDPRSVGFGQLVNGLSCAVAGVAWSRHMKHDRMGVKGLNVLEAPAGALRLKHDKEVLHKRHDRRFMEGDPHGHVDASRLPRKRLQQRAQAASVRENHQRAVELFGGQVAQDVPNVLGLADGGAAGHRMNLRGMRGQMPPRESGGHASVLAHKQPRFIVHVVDVGCIGVPKDLQRPDFVPLLEAHPFGPAHGRQACGQHVVHVQSAFAFGHASRQVGPGGHAVLTQCVVQLLVHGGKPTPLTFKRFLVFGPRRLSKAPIFNPLDVGQILEHRMHIGQFVVDGCKIAKHHGRPRHKPIKRQLGLSVVDKVVKTRQDFEGVRRSPRRGILHKSRQRIEARESCWRGQLGLKRPSNAAHGAVAGQHHRQAVELLRFAAGMGQDGLQDFVEEGGAGQCGRVETGRAAHQPLKVKPFVTNVQSSRRPSLVQMVRWISPQNVLGAASSSAAWASPPEMGVGLAGRSSKAGALDSGSMPCSFKMPSNSSLTRYRSWACSW